jgi:hypothetical protein
LDDFGSFASKDLDYFGDSDVAKKLAMNLGGKLHLPVRDETHFHPAIVNAKVDGINVDIDFLTHVLGVGRDLQGDVVELVFPVGEKEEVAIRLMHPLHCFQSRIANILKLGRSDENSRRQAEAAPIVVREYISEALSEGDQRAATDTLKALFKYLRSDIYGRDAHKVLPRDPLEILRHFRDDVRLDQRFRERSLTNMIEKLEKKRGAGRST